MRTNLNICLCNATLVWYISELFNLEKIELQNNENSVKEWCWAFKNQFKNSAAVILISFTFIKYTMTDAQNHWKSSIYIQIILHYVKLVNIKSVENQLIFIY